jgi:hypothetical protein
MIKSVKVFANNEKKNAHNVAKWPVSATTPWTLTLGDIVFLFSVRERSWLEK